MRTLAFLDPGHFHAALTLREANPRVREEIAVHAEDGPELAEFLALVESFNRRAERPTRWRPRVAAGPDPLGRLLADRPADLVVLAGRNDRKAGWMRRLHGAGLALLVDKPWLVDAAALPDLRHVLAGGPPAVELLTGRHDVATAVELRLAAEPDLLGGLGAPPGEPAVVLDSVHHLEKRVNGAPLRRPPWYFDVAVQGDGIADIPTHLVDHAQRLRPGAPLALVSARRWPTLVPRELFARVTGAPDFPAAVAARVEGGRLAYLGNAELRFHAGDLLVHCRARWTLSEPPGGGDSSLVHLRGTRADLRVELSARTGWTRRILVEPHGDAGAAARVRSALGRALDAWRPDWPGLGLAERDGALEVVVPAALASRHESHFPLVLDETLDRLDGPARRAPDAAATLARYELLARALVACRTDPPEP